jgi:hypothetical protein
VDKDPTPLATRRAAFAALVAAQDRGLTVGASRAEVARQFDLTVPDVQKIEREGMEGQWPPLGDAADE